MAGSVVDKDWTLLGWYTLYNPSRRKEEEGDKKEEQDKTGSPFAGEKVSQPFIDAEQERKVLGSDDVNQDSLKEENNPEERTPKMEGRKSRGVNMKEVRIATEQNKASPHLVGKVKEEKEIKLPKLTKQWLRRESRKDHLCKKEIRKLANGLPERDKTHYGQPDYSNFGEIGRGTQKAVSKGNNGKRYEGNALESNRVDEWKDDTGIVLTGVHDGDTNKNIKKEGPKELADKQEQKHGREKRSEGKVKHEGSALGPVQKCRLLRPEKEDRTRKQGDIFGGQHARRKLKVDILSSEIGEGACGQKHGINGLASGTRSNRKGTELGAEGGASEEMGTCKDIEREAATEEENPVPPDCDTEAVHSEFLNGNRGKEDDF